jgi:hypothetical protein
MFATTSSTSLEIAKLGVAALVPIAVVVLGVPIALAIRRIDQAQWAHQKLIELRLELYAEMAPALNDLLCFFRLVGDWQTITPPKALKRKRELDKAFHVGEYLMSDEFAHRYRAFISACFMTYTARGKPAQLLASRTRQRAERPDWSDEWDDLLIPETVAPTSLAELGESYRSLMLAFSEAIGVREHKTSTRRRRVVPPVALIDDDVRSWPPKWSDK